MDQFAQQLANLQRAASRAGRDDGGRGNSGASSSGGGGGGGSGDRHGGNHGHHNDDDRGRRGDHSRDGNNNDRYRNNNHHRDNNYRRSDGGGRDYNPRKRDRSNSRDYHGRGSSSFRGRGGGRGRFEGRWNGDHDRGRGGNSTTADVPLAELVKQVAEKYIVSTEDNNEAPATTNATATTGKKQRHIALLFLTISGLPHEHIWKEWLKSSDNDDDVLVSVLCHAKSPERIQSPWLRQRHLLRKQYNNDDRNSKAETFHSRHPEWGSIEITRAMIDLLEEGLRIGGEKDENGQPCSYHRYLSTPSAGDGVSTENDTADGTTADANPSSIPSVDRFVFVSESCLPVATLKELELALFGPRDTVSKDASSDKPQNANDCNGNDKQPKLPTKNTESLYNKSWINARSTPNNGYARQLQWDSIRPTDIPPNLVWKADQWLVLTRPHAGAIAAMPNKYLQGRQLWPTLRQCRASDEMFFPTALSILGILHRRPGMSEVEDDTITSKKESCAGDGIRRRRITYCDWSMGAKNPASFTCVEWRDVVAKARGEGCLFARKFVLASSIRGERKKERGGGASVVDSSNGLVRVEDWISAVVKGGS